MAKHVALVGRIYDTGATRITTGFGNYLMTGAHSLEDGKGLQGAELPRR